jgi:hypothetical protein
VVKSSDILEQQIEQVSSRNGVSAHTLRRLLSLEDEHRNLHSWGARPALRRDIEAIIEEDMAEGNGG